MVYQPEEINHKSKLLALAKAHGYGLDYSHRQSRYEGAPLVYKFTDLTNYPSSFRAVFPYDKHLWRVARFGPKDLSINKGGFFPQKPQTGPGSPQNTIVQKSPVPKMECIYCVDCFDPVSDKKDNERYGYEHVDGFRCQFKPWVIYHGRVLELPKTDEERGVLPRVIKPKKYTKREIEDERYG